MQGAEFINTEIENVNFQGANLQNADFMNSGIEYSDMRGALVAGADFTNVTFMGTKIGGVDFTQSILTNTDFEGADYNVTKAVSAQKIEKVLMQTPSKINSNYKTPYINLSINFAFDSDQLEPLGVEQVRQLAEALNSPHLQKSPFIIEGHTDSSGSDAYNQDLSYRRAITVMKILTHHRVDSNRLSIKGYGESRPAVSNATEFGRAQNRRVTIVKVK